MTQTIATVSRCMPRHDGGYMILLNGGGSASSPTPIPEGARVVVKGGVASRAAPK